MHGAEFKAQVLAECQRPGASVAAVALALAHGLNVTLVRKWFVDRGLAGQRAAMVMSLVQSARLNGHDPFAYLSDVLRRLPTQLNSRLEELLPHRWAPTTA